MSDPKSGGLPPAAYVNLLRVAFNPAEFFLAFAQRAQSAHGGGGAHLVASLVTTPVYAKAMLKALSESIDSYEKRFGEIPAMEQPQAEAPERSSRGARAKGSAPPRPGRETKARAAEND